MKILNKFWLNKERPSKKLLKLQEQEDALKMLATYPIRDFLIATMDELVRGAIYLNEKDLIGARYSVELLTGLIKKGDRIIKKEEKK